MKKIFLILITSSLSLVLSSQELMTIRETFDFKIGDEFQYEGSADNEPPNADRIKVIGKYFSENEDTLIYILFHDSYHTYIQGGELQYHFFTKTDTVYYTNLDSSLVYYDDGFLLNQYIYYSAELCDTLINGCSYEVGPGFENDSYTQEYGKGLGLVFNYHYSGLGGTVDWRNTLFYYKKGDNECGNPDTTTGLFEYFPMKYIFEVFPNPAKDWLYIKPANPNSYYSLNIELRNLYGQLVKEETDIQSTHYAMNVADLKAGVYFYVIKEKGEIVQQGKLIIK
jgi:hypothetical protein